MSDETFVDSEKPTAEEKSAVYTPEPKAPEAKTEKPEGEKPEQNRDEKGKWANSAVAEERNRRKSLQAELDKERAERKADRERSERLEKRFNELANPPKPPPDPRQDFDGYMNHKLQPLKQFVEETAKEKRERQAAEAQTNVQNEFRNAVLSREAEFRKTATDYDEAAEHWKSQRRADLIENGVDEDDAEQAMNAELRWRAEKALAAGKNPAEVLYSLAKRAGFTGKAQEKPEKGDDEFDAMERATRASRSLGASSGSAPAKITVQDIADMSDDDFAALMNKSGPENVRRMLRG